MTTRAVGPGHGWNWLAQAINLGRNNPQAIFGGAALLLAVAMALAVGLALVAGAAQLAVRPGPAAGAAMSTLLFLPLLAIVCALMVGYLRLLDAAESGRPARALDVFAGFRDLATSARVFGLVVLLTLAQYLLMIGLIAALAPDFGAWYLQALQASAAGAPPPDATSLPPGFGRAFAVTLLVTLVAYAVQAIGVGQIALRERSLPGALGDGVSGTFKNLLPLVVLVLIGLGVAIVAVLAVFLVAMLLGVLGKLVGLWLAVLLAIPLYLAALVAMYVIAFGVMYFMWRDICSGATPPALRSDQVEV